MKIENRILYAMAIIALGTITVTSLVDFLEADARAIPNIDKNYSDYKENPTCENIVDRMKIPHSQRGGGYGALSAQWILMECWKQ